MMGRPKIYCTGIFFLATSFCNAQNKSEVNAAPFKLSGKIVGRDTGCIVLWAPDSLGNYSYDTSNLKKGTFEYKGFLTEPAGASLSEPYGRQKFVGIYLEKGSLSITMEENNFNLPVIEGSKTQREADSLDKEIEDVNATLSALWAENKRLHLILKNTGDSNFHKTVYDRVSDENSQLEVAGYNLRYLVKMAFIKQHPDSYVSPAELLEIINTLPLEASVLLYNQFSSTIKNSRVGKMCAAEISIREKVKKGALIPNFKASDINGHAVSLDQFKGKYVLLYFWGSGCAPCIKAMPHMISVYDRYHGKGFEIISVCLDKEKQDWEAVVKKEGIGIWTNVLQNEEIKQTFNVVRVLSTAILLDPGGRIEWSSMNDTAERWENIVEKRLAK